MTFKCPYFGIFYSFIHSTHTHAGSKMYKIHFVTSLLQETKEERREKSSKDILQNGRRKNKTYRKRKFYRLPTLIFVPLQLHIQIQKNSFIHSTNTKQPLKSRQC